jgi:hypothetical protein
MKSGTEPSTVLRYEARKVHLISLSVKEKKYYSSKYKTANIETW